MKKLNTLRLSMLATGILLVTAIEGFAQPGVAQCDYKEKKFAKAIDTDFGGCVKIRKDDANGNAAGPIAWSLTSKSRFATHCPVRIKRPAVHHGTNCSKLQDNSNALQDDDLVRVNEWGADQLELVILRVGQRVFHPLQGPVMLEPVTLTLQGQPHRIGYRAHALIPSATNPLLPISVQYYVYLAHHYDTTARTTIRRYEVEVFDGAPDCLAERPGQNGAETELVTCPADNREPKQLPSGGGGEPDPPG